MLPFRLCHQCYRLRSCIITHLDRLIIVWFNELTDRIASSCHASSEVHLDDAFTTTIPCMRTDELMKLQHLPESVRTILRINHLYKYGDMFRLLVIFILDHPLGTRYDASINPFMHAYIHPPTNQWTKSTDTPNHNHHYQSIDQSINKFINQSINQTIDQPINQSIS
jgi:hypothetical protein